MEGRPAGLLPVVESFQRQTEILGFCILEHCGGSFSKCSQFKVDGSSSQACFLFALGLTFVCMSVWAYIFGNVYMVWGHMV